MSYQVLARKWRPKKFNEVIGQDHIVKSIQNSIKENRIAQAYLLTGTRGVGKTTIARLFAKALMCPNKDHDQSPCGKCESCLAIDSGTSMDFIEIDGATNNGVESVRQLIENVQYLPTQGDYKVYVIDEVHMLSVSAFNALLKTLEEPPKHVIFIFATTDPHKLLGTVLSRCQRFDFKNQSIESLANHVKRISKLENITFENDLVVNKLAKQGKGSVRDTLSLFDQVLSLSEDKNISDETLTLALGLAGTQAISNIITGVLREDTELCAETMTQILNENINLEIFTTQLLDSIFQIIQKIDSKSELSELNLVDEETIQDIKVSELFWIYETMAKDFEWALKSISPSDVIVVVIKKLCMRNDIFSNKPIELKESKKKVKINPEAETLYSKIFEINPSLAANLEHGNVTNINKGENLFIEIGFAQKDKLFFEHLNETETYKNLLDSISKIYNYEISKINLVMSVIGTEKKGSNFQSKRDILVKEEEDKEKAKEEKIRNNTYVKEAQKLFSTKIDKVVINKE